MKGWGWAWRVHQWSSSNTECTTAHGIRSNDSRTTIMPNTEVQGKQGLFYTLTKSDGKWVRIVFFKCIDAIVYHSTTLNFELNCTGLIIILWDICLYFDFS